MKKEKSQKVLLSGIAMVGEEMRKENVTPRGNPALVNPINSGIEEQEQNGVTVPSRAAIMLAHIP